MTLFDKCFITGCDENTEWDSVSGLCVPCKDGADWDEITKKCVNK